MELILKAKDIRVEFKGRDVLDIDNLEVYDYDRIGLVGANGAGKSTLFKVLLGELTPLGCKMNRLGELAYIGYVIHQHHGIFLTHSLKTDGPKERTEVTFDDLQSNLKDISTCYLCGSSDYSMMDYYRKFDTVGLISLNDWYVLDFQLKAYDENGNEISNKTSSNVLFGNTGEITYSSHGDVSRGMAEIDITLPENYKLNKRNLTDHLCQSCLDKVAASLEYWKYENEKKEPIPLCLVDFKTLDIYSLQDYYRSIFIRDYYVEMNFEDNSVETKAFYLPERL